jgi:hypothetical protein
MKYSLIILSLFLSTVASSQTIIAKTEDGRRVLLNEDKTWEFIDKVASKTASADEIFPDCNLPSDFEEPEGNKKIRSWLKRVDATVEDLKDHVAVDNNCSKNDIKITSVSEQRGNGNYLKFL